MKNRLLLMIATFLFAAAIDAKKLPKLMTKQDLSNLRFISEDGRFSYYQMKSGKFLLVRFDAIRCFGLCGSALKVCCLGIRRYDEPPPALRDGRGRSTC